MGWCWQVAAQQPQRLMAPSSLAARGKRLVGGAEVAMRPLAIPTILVLLSTGCGGPYALIEGNVAGKDLSQVNTVMFGGPFIVFADADLDCLDMSFVSRHYTQGEAVTDFDFRLLQFAFTDPDVFEGVFNLAGEASVTAKFVSQTDGAFGEHRGREGILEVDALEADKLALGIFDVSFDEGSLSGEYEAEWCRNLKDN